jgi:putative acetyltransferase
MAMTAACADARGLVGRAVPDVHIRLERPDHPAIMALLGELDAYLAGLYAPEHNHILDVQALLSPDVSFLAARCGSRWLGCGAIRRMPAESDTGEIPYAEVKRMYVRPEARGERLAERLLERLEQLAHERGVDRTLLETGRDQHAAIRLYERCGYRQRGPFGGYPDNGLSLFYQKRLA